MAGDARAPLISAHAGPGSSLISPTRRYKLERAPETSEARAILDLESLAQRAQWPGM
jgi:hypothetical protein